MVSSSGNFTFRFKKMGSVAIDTPASRKEMSTWEDTELIITDDYIQEANSKEYVMMRWETPIMQAHVDHVAKEGGDFLEIGFGLGISAGMFQAYNPNSYTVIESHPQIIPLAQAWAGNVGGNGTVTVLEGDWHDLLGNLTPNTYDGIFFDTYNEANDFMDLQPLLKPDGKLTYFNGMADTTTANVILDLVISCTYTDAELESIVEYCSVPKTENMYPWYGIMLTALHTEMNHGTPYRLCKWYPISYAIPRGIAYTFHAVAPRTSQLMFNYKLPIIGNV